MASERDASPYLKSVLAPQTIFLGHARDRERLAGEAPNQDVMIRDIRALDASDVARRGVPEIGCVCLLGVLVPIGRENTLGTCRFEGQAHPADPAEQIDKLGTFHRIALHL